MPTLEEPAHVSLDTTMGYLHALARKFACADPARMKWSANGALRQCSGCACNCGMTVFRGDWTEALFGEATLFGQLELFAATTPIPHH